MSYHEESIVNIVKKIGANEIYLPAIQRRFVWKHTQIVSLFDSIMRGYPIGTFLFWYLPDHQANEYTFYKFLKNYHEREAYLNVVAPKPNLNNEVVGVLDGQQRLSSMYIALQGTYAYKRPYARWDNPDAFEPRQLYLNLLGNGSAADDEDLAYHFAFKTEKEAAEISAVELWFPVRNVLTWGQDPEIDEYYDSLIEHTQLPPGVLEVLKQKRPDIKRNIRIIHQRLVIEKLISYFKIQDMDLDEILNIFVRVNSGGTILSKSDLLLSTIIAHWQDGREEIENLIDTLRNKGDGFHFDNDFVMRACLVLSDLPILFKVNSFKKDNIALIQKNWDQIRTSLLRTVDLAVEFGFSGETLTSQNALIPIAYYFFKGGDDGANSKAGIRKYLIHALLKRVFGSHGDQALARLREELRERRADGSYVLKRNRFEFSALTQVMFSGNRSLLVSQDDIEEILEMPKGAYSFMALSLLYPNLNFAMVKFHQDHIHPASQFTNAELRKADIPEKDWKEWRSKRDRLPNLQLLEGRENKRKSDTPLLTWLNGSSNGGPNVPDIQKYKQDNYIPDVDLGFASFEEFYNERKEILRAKLSSILA